MKFLALLLPLLAIGAMGLELQHAPVEATYQGRSVAGIVVDIMYCVRDKMPYGFPKLGIPPLAPFEIADKLVKFETGSVKVELQIKNFALNGLDNFDVKTMKINPALGRMSFEMLYENVNITTWYSIKIHSSGGLQINYEREGNAFVAMKYFSVAGESDYNLALKGGVVSINTFYLFFNVAQVISNIENLSPKPYMNKVVNDIVEEWISIAINDYSQEFGELISQVVTTAANSAINGRTLEEIIAAITGGGSSKDLRDVTDNCPIELGTVEA